MKVALFIVLLALIAVPAFSWRFREWNNSNCKGDPEATSHNYKNKMTSCQPLFNVPNRWFTFTSDCKKHKTTAVLEFTDAACTVRAGSPRALGVGRAQLEGDPDFWYVSGGCQSLQGVSRSWNIDCSEDKP